MNTSYLSGSGVKYPSKKITWCFLFSPAQPPLPVPLPAADVMAPPTSSLRSAITDAISAPHFTPPSPPDSRAATSVPHSTPLWYEQPPSEVHLTTSPEPLRAPVVLHAYTTYFPIDIQFSFHTPTTIWDPLSNFLFHPRTPFSGLPTQISVYQTRTLFCDTAADSLRCTLPHHSPSASRSPLPPQLRAVIALLGVITPRLSFHSRTAGATPAWTPTQW
ncbi:hypothetical protein C8R44DRAFT_869224 [Mycena epipterygia]|nr:hypothetical protein C8R44DRAFT_869224 [Mycena epipterygia]